ncbi:hypothetical protein [Helicobacter bizzozeronii]|uniref:hypothetical protein n=1 Tax=Helicobacter bizzozeronii TaxID=56877 RepID=UPI00024E5B37|nr:hypothetical protein [Helicobacter bizzozeronii]CCF80955.1 hypothetical protein HBZS_114040 [Helicobacter bizzozeronii CCUG 35545]
MSEKKDLGNYLNNAERGAVVYCDIAHTGFMGKLKHIGGKATFEHSGIYIGEVDGQHLIAEIVNDNGEAKVRYTDSHRFMARLEQEPKKEGVIYVACSKENRNRALSDDDVYERATKGVIGNQELIPHKLYDIKSIKSKLTYDPLCDVNLFSNPKDRTNCHKFVQWCLVGKFKDKYGDFKMLEDNIRSELGGFQWVPMTIKS